MKSKLLAALLSLCSAATAFAQGTVVGGPFTPGQVIIGGCPGDVPAGGPTICVNGSASSFGAGIFSETPGPAGLGEILLQNNRPGENTFAIENQSPTGFSAYTVRSADQVYPDTSFTADGNYEHMAIGFGQNLLLNGFKGYDYIEASRFNGTNSTPYPPTRLSIEQTGAVLTGSSSATAFTCATTATSTAMTCTTNAPANGATVYSPWLAGVIPPLTTIVSGGGTTTPVLSNPAGTTLAAGFFLMGVPTFGQWHFEIYQEQGPINYYSWFNSGANPGNPFFTIDRQNGRIGINTGAVAKSNLVSDLPVTDLDVVGRMAIGGCSTANRAQFATSSPITVCDGGPLMFELFKAGTNQLQLNWNAAPSRLDFHNANNNINPISLLMDATAGVTFGNGIMMAGTPPVLTGTCTTGSQVGGNTAGKFTATCTAQTVIMTFAMTATNGWACKSEDNTTPADSLKQTGFTTTTATFTGTTAASDAVTFSCIAF
jgi:hypothetical protein